MLLTQKKTLFEGYQKVGQNNTGNSISTAESKKQKPKELKEKWSEN